MCSTTALRDLRALKSVCAPIACAVLLRLRLRLGVFFFAPSSDLGQVDEQLAEALFDTLQIATLCAASVAVACAVLPLLCALVPPLVWGMLKLRRYTTRSMRELKRLDGVTRSPVYGAFRATMQGLPCIRAFARTEQAQIIFEEKLT